MAICVYEYGNTTIRNDGTLVENCTDYILLTPADYASLTESGNSLPVDDPAVNLLLGSVIALLVLSWLFRQALNQLFNRK